MDAVDFVATVKTIYQNIRRASMANEIFVVTMYTYTLKYNTSIHKIRCLLSYTISRQMRFTLNPL